MKITKLVTVFLVLLLTLSACTSPNNKLKNNPLFQEQFTNVAYIRIYESTAPDLNLFYSEEASDIMSAQELFNGWDSTKNQTPMQDTLCQYVIQFGDVLKINVSSSDSHYGWYCTGDTYNYCILPEAVLKFIESKL